MTENNNRNNEKFMDYEKSNHDSKNEIIKQKIAEKYNISLNDADKILTKINIKKDLMKKSELTSDNNTIKEHDQLTMNSYPKETSNILKEENNTKKLNEEKNNNSISNNNINRHYNEQSLHEDNTPKKDVDSILEEIIPNYDQQISIKLEHVDLTFEAQNEKIDTIKEAFIRILKGEKTDKIKVHALKDVSIQIYKGEKVGIIGYNGAGKSTLLNIITGIYPPDKGTVVTHGTISPLLSLGAGFDYNYSGRKNIMLNGAVLGYEKEYLKSKVDEIIEFSELGEFIDIPIKNYSSGMLAKLGFSIATSVNPDILIIDEILGVGDVNFKKKSGDKIKSLMNGGTTVLLVSHSIAQIRELCDRAIWICDGRVRDSGEVNAVCDAYLKDAEKASKEQLANIQLT